jgi:hypothetical protein
MPAQQTRTLEYWLKLSAGALLLLYMLAVLAKENVADPDLWGYMAFGRLFWEGGRFPYQDVFAYVPTLDPWVYHEWLTGVLFYPLYRGLGEPGLLMVKYLFALGALGFIYLTARRRGADPWAAGIMAAVVAGGVAIGYATVTRAQVFTYFFFALSLYLLESARLSGRWRYLGPAVLVQVLWCNLHGGFVAGWGLLGLYAAGEFLSRRPCLPYVGALAAAVLITLINPYGPDYWSYMFRALTMPRPQVTEWASVYRVYQTGVANLSLLLYVGGLAAMGLLAFWQARRRELTAGLILLVTLALGLRHSRHLPFFFLAFGALVPVCLNMHIDYLKSRRLFQAGWPKPAKAAVLVALLAANLLLGYGLVSHNPLSLKIPAEPWARGFYYPVGAVDYIKEQGLAGRILSEFDWGEYLLWHLYPDSLVGFDGRYETVYPADVEHDFINFIYAQPGWRTFLEKYPPDLILLKRGKKIAGLMAQEPQWVEIYADQGSVLFKREGLPAPLPAAAKAP